MGRDIHVAFDFVSSSLVLLFLAGRTLMGIVLFCLSVYFLGSQASGFRYCLMEGLYPPFLLVLCIYNT